MTDESDANRQLAAFAHEIRNPLALIRANLQFVELTDRKRKSKKNYEIIYREIDRISDILNLCMASSHGIRLEPRRFKIAVLLNEIEQAFKPSLIPLKIKLATVTKDDIELVADYDKLKQVLINVVQNAREGIEALDRSSGGLIEILAYLEEDFVNIRITDNGVGVSASDLKMIGTPFFTKKEKGCGLGVSISKDIIERHKGSFQITGEENKGACVLIRLPHYN